MFLSRERRRTLALYMLARIAQCLYNSLKQQGLFHFWGSDWAYGDALLFALSSAQVKHDTGSGRVQRGAANCVWLSTWLHHHFRCAWPSLVPVSIHLIV